MNQKYFIEYSYPCYYLITRKKFLGFIPYWATLYSSGILENVEKKFKELTNESSNNRGE